MSKGDKQDIAPEQKQDQGQKPRPEPLADVGRRISGSAFTSITVSADKRRSQTPAVGNSQKQRPEHTPDTGSAGLSAGLTDVSPLTYTPGYTRGDIARNQGSITIETGKGTEHFTAAIVKIETLFSQFNKTTAKQDLAPATAIMLVDKISHDFAGVMSGIDFRAKNPLSEPERVFTQESMNHYIIEVEEAAKAYVRAKSQAPTPASGAIARNGGFFRTVEIFRRQMGQYKSSAQQALETTEDTRSPATPAQAVLEQAPKVRVPQPMVVYPQQMSVVHGMAAQQLHPTVAALFIQAAAQEQKSIADDFVHANAAIKIATEHTTHEIAQSESGNIYEFPDFDKESAGRTQAMAQLEKVKSQDAILQVIVKPIHNSFIDLAKMYQTGQTNQESALIHYRRYFRRLDMLVFPDRGDSDQLRNNKRLIQGSCGEATAECTKALFPILEHSCFASLETGMTHMQRHDALSDKPRDQAAKAQAQQMQVMFLRQALDTDRQLIMTVGHESFEQGKRKEIFLILDEAITARGVPEEQHWRDSYRSYAERTNIIDFLDTAQTEVINLARKAVRARNRGNFDGAFEKIVQHQIVAERSPVKFGQDLYDMKLQEMQYCMEYRATLEQIGGNAPKLNQLSQRAKEIARSLVDDNGSDKHLTNQYLTTHDANQLKAVLLDAKEYRYTTAGLVAEDNPTIEHHKDVRSLCRRCTEKGILSFTHPEEITVAVQNTESGKFIEKAKKKNTEQRKKEQARFKKLSEDEQKAEAAAKDAFDGLIAEEASLETERRTQFEQAKASVATESVERAAPPATEPESKTPLVEVREVPAYEQTYQEAILLLGRRHYELAQKKFEEAAKTAAESQNPKSNIFEIKSDVMTIEFLSQRARRSMVNIAKEPVHTSLQEAIRFYRAANDREASIFDKLDLYSLQHEEIPSDMQDAVQVREYLEHTVACNSQRLLITQQELTDLHRRQTKERDAAKAKMGDEAWRNNPKGGKSEKALLREETGRCIETITTYNQEREAVGKLDACSAVGRKPHVMSIT